MDAASAGLRRLIHARNPPHNKRDDLPDCVCNRAGTAREKGNRSSHWLGLREAHQTPLPTIRSHCQSQRT